VLKLRELATCRQSCDAEYLNKQHTKLELNNRASQDAQIVFLCHSYRNDEVHISHIHDLSISDPFDLSLCQFHCFSLCLFAQKTKPILVFYKQQTKEIKHRLCAKEIIQSNQISPSISEARACLPNQSLTPTAPRTRAPLAL
jgi:hypothetical protein